jgi:hypothetical protein
MTGSKSHPAPTSNRIRGYAICYSRQTPRSARRAPVAVFLTEKLRNDPITPGAAKGEMHGMRLPTIQQ